MLSLPPALETTNLIMLFGQPLNQKRALHKLTRLIKHPPFLRAFLDQGGVKVLMEAVKQNLGPDGSIGALSYGLVSLNIIGVPPMGETAEEFLRQVKTINMLM